MHAHYVGEKDEETLRRGAATSHHRSEHWVASPLLQRESCIQTMQASSQPGLQYVNSILPLLPEHNLIPCGESRAPVVGEDEEMLEEENTFLTHLEAVCWVDDTDKLPGS